MISIVRNLLSSSRFKIPVYRAGLFIRLLIIAVYGYNRITNKNTVKRLLFNWFSILSKIKVSHCISITYPPIIIYIQEIQGQKLPEGKAHIGHPELF